MVNDERPRSFLGAGRVVVCVHGARDLASLPGRHARPDTTVSISYEDKKVQSELTSGTRSPTWDLAVEIDVDQHSPDTARYFMFSTNCACSAIALQLKHCTDRVEVVDGEFVLGWVELDLAGVGAGAGLDRDWLPLEGTNTGHIQVSGPSVRTVH